MFHKKTESIYKHKLTSRHLVPTKSSRMSDKDQCLFIVAVESFTVSLRAREFQGVSH